MYGALLVLRVLTRKYEFRDDVSAISCTVASALLPTLVQSTLCTSLFF
jgi:hypothetical protein